MSREWSDCIDSGVIQQCDELVKVYRCGVCDAVVGYNVTIKVK